MSAAGCWRDGDRNTRDGRPRGPQVTHQGGSCLQNRPVGAGAGGQLKNNSQDAAETGADSSGAFVVLHASYGVTGARGAAFAKVFLTRPRPAW